MTNCVLELLTFRPQHGHDIFKLDAEYHSSDDNRCQRGLRNESTSGHEDDEGEDYYEACERKHNMSAKFVTPINRF